MMRRTGNAFLTGALAAVVIVSGGAAFAGEREDAERFARAIQKSASGRMVCRPRHNARAILCLLHTSDREADKIAKGIVYLAQVNDVGLPGWKLTLVTTDSYVVTATF